MLPDCFKPLVMPSIFQSQFTEEGFKKTENSEHSGVLLMFLFILDSFKLLYFICCQQREGNTLVFHYAVKKEKGAHFGVPLCWCSFMLSQTQTRIIMLVFLYVVTDTDTKTDDPDDRRRDTDTD